MRYVLHMDEHEKRIVIMRNVRVRLGFLGLNEAALCREHRINRGIWRNRQRRDQLTQEALQWLADSVGLPLQVLRDGLPSQVCRWSELHPEHTHGRVYLSRFERW